MRTKKISFFRKFVFKSPPKLVPKFFYKEKKKSFFMFVVDDLDIWHMVLNGTFYENRYLNVNFIVFFKI